MGEILVIFAQLLISETEIFQRINYPLRNFYEILIACQFFVFLLILLTSQYSAKVTEQNHDYSQGS